MDSNILKKIKALPPLDDTITKIQRICTDKDSSLNDLVKVVEGDPMLTANILKSSNSPLYGFSREIKNISHAISLFGMATIRGFALSSAIKQNIKIDLSPYDLTNHKFLEISIAQSALTFNWFSKVDREMLDILVPASFMMEVGKIVIAHELIEKNLTEKFQAKLKTLSSPDEVSQLEKEFIGFDNEEITAKIFEQWNLEEELVETIRYSNTPSEADEHIQPYATALQIIKKCINIFGQLQDNNIASSLEVLAQHNLNQEVFLNAIEKVKQ
ncbi:HDOD domain-containing protein [Sulfurospirillum arcachonense]|uniref:HDOD domain-containing protein n=1 Tax=Sulfurospirillum arcachonense TaxID=57666 RepID=UPI00046AE115|nr:HDOD domain-containing protein [Sulfurospirillum arcachonense]